MAGERFSAELWSGVEEIYAAIVAHPFVTGLGDGSLERESFEFYVVQDARYLREYARALSLAAARAPSEPDIAMFNRHSVGAVEVERSVHESFFAEFGLSQSDVTGTAMAPTNVASTSYLLATASGGSFSPLLGAVLACSWIYGEVGKFLVERGSPDGLYWRWIDTYGGEAFGEIVRAVLDLTDRVGAGLGLAERARAAGCFITISRYEWMFWEMGYRRARWPV